MQNIPNHHDDSIRVIPIQACLDFLYFVYISKNQKTIQVLRNVKSR